MPPRPKGQQVQCGNGLLVLTQKSGDICQCCKKSSKREKWGVHDCNLSGHSHTIQQWAACAMTA